MSAYFSISKVLCGVLGNVQVLNTRSRSRRFGDERVGRYSFICQDFTTELL